MNAVIELEAAYEHDEKISMSKTVWICHILSSFLTADTKASILDRDLNLSGSMPELTSTAYGLSCFIVSFTLYRSSLPARKYGLLMWRMGSRPKHTPCPRAGVQQDVVGMLCSARRTSWGDGKGLEDGIVGECPQSLDIVSVLAAVVNSTFFLRDA